MKKFLFFAAAIIIFASCSYTTEKTEIEVDPALPRSEYCAFVIADAGRNGAFDQTKIGQVMGVYAEALEPEFVLNAGDMFHYNGVESVDDPLFMTNYELIYPHGELHCPWYGVLGNHEYHGTTQAVIDYTKRSRRWNVPARYYTQTFEGIDDFEQDSIKVFFIDTVPMIDKYHEEEGYPDARLQDPEKQIEWLDKELGKSSNAKWKIAIGHHPIYSYSKKSPKETAQMQERVAALYQKHGVDLSLAGHVHTFQHLQVPSSETEYIVCPSASLSRAPRNGEYTKYNNGDTGFIVLGFEQNTMTLSMINAEGKMLYTYTIK